jgi:sulfatase modifying factor 1
MKRLHPLFILFSVLGAALRLTAQPQMVLLPEEAETARRVVWSTEPGIRYVLQVSNDLSDPLAWQDVDGFPSEATALAQQHAIEQMTGDRLFYRVVQLDEQPPKISNRLPADGAFGVGRFSPITLSLQDRSGVDPDSIVLQIGEGDPITISDTALTFDDGVLSYDLGGDSALGAWGDLIELSLTVSDTLGNTATYEWLFELEREIQVAENLFVFGSPDAQRAGQRLEGPAATVAARFGGPVRMSGSELEWQISGVTENTVLITYTSDDAPVFSVGQKITNLAPAHVDEIFYREVTSVAVNTSEKVVTLGTEDRMLADFMTDGSFTFGDGAEMLEFDENGHLVAMRSLTVDLPTIGADFSGTTVYDSGPLALTLPEARALFHPTITLSLEMDSGEVERFAAKAQGDFDLAVVPELTLSGSYNNSISQELWRHGFWMWTAVGFVPVGVEVSASVTANASIEVGAQATFTTGFRQAAFMGVQGVYLRDSTPSVTWDRWFNLSPLEQVPFTYTLDGEGTATVSLVPQIDVRLYGAVGIYLNTDPRLVLNGSASMTDGVLTEASWLFGAYADVNAGLSVIGFSNDQLPALPPFRFFTFEWGDSYDIAPSPTVPITITRQPLSQNARAGDAVCFTVDASGPPNLQFQWYQNGLMLAGRTQRHLDLANVNAGHAGQYHARVRDAAGQSVNSNPAQLTLLTSLNTGPAPAGMVRVQGGTLQTTNALNGTVVGTFYIGRHEVTWGEWKAVRAHAAARGYDIGNIGEGCADNHPVHSVNWYDVLKWCNLKSELEGLTPVYTFNGTTFKETQPAHTSIIQNPAANGYRLPLEAEWEFAARGGNQSNGYTYSGSNDLNLVGWYWDNSGGAACNLFSGRGTWPVGQKAANELGLHDMSGNVWEWCWDQSGSARHVRGGGWGYGASLCPVSYRYPGGPGSRALNYGFRLARSSGN